MSRPLPSQQCCEGRQWQMTTSVLFLPLSYFQTCQSQDNLRPRSRSLGLRFYCITSTGNLYTILYPLTVHAHMAAFLNSLSRERPRTDLNAPLNDGSQHVTMFLFKFGRFLFKFGQFLFKFGRFIFKFGRFFIQIRSVFIQIRSAFSRQTSRNTYTKSS